LPGKSYDCWTLVEHREGRPARVSLELLGKGRELAGKLGGANVALVFGSDIDELASEAARYGAERVVAIEDESLSGHQPEAWSQALRFVVEQAKPHVLLIPATTLGRDIGARVAGELELGMTGDCVGLGIDRGGRLIQTKPAYGGNIVSVIMGATTPQLATVRPRMFEPVEPRDVNAPVERLELGALPERRTQLIEHRASPAWDLDEADVVVCIGPEVRGLPELPAGIALGATRTACEQGALPRNRQLGLFGRAVAPRLLIAIAVPGDFEELAAFVKADVIVSIGGGKGMEDRADVVFRGDSAELLAELIRQR
jgi:electron transfer flavoprotein alpha subunit